MIIEEMETFIGGLAVDWINRYAGQARGKSNPADYLWGAYSPLSPLVNRRVYVGEPSSWQAGKLVGKPTGAV